MTDLNAQQVKRLADIVSRRAPELLDEMTLFINDEDSRSPEIANSLRDLVSQEFVAVGIEADSLEPNLDGLELERLIDVLARAGGVY